MRNHFWQAGFCFVLSLESCSQNNKTYQNNDGRQPVVIDLGETNPDTSASKGQDAQSKTTSTAETGEQVTPPTQITGAYLTMKVLSDSASALQIGFTAFQPRGRFSAESNRYAAAWGATSSGNVAGISLSIGSSASGAQDQIVTIKGPSAEAIRAALPSITVELHVTETVDSTTNRDDIVVNLGKLMKVP